MTTNDLVNIIAPYAQCRTTTSSQIFGYKTMLSDKFNKINKLKSYKDFLFTKNSTNQVTVSAKAHMYDGEWIDITEQFVKEGKHNINTTQNKDQFSYAMVKKSKPLDAAKLLDLEKCARHVPHDKQLFYIALKTENSIYGKIAEAEDIRQEMLS